jgi:predicted nucleic acid-binding protein
MHYLLDTNVLSEPAKPRPDPRVVRWFARQSPLDLAISVLTLGEIEKGVRLLPAGKRRDRLSGWLEADLPRRFAGRLLAVDERVSRAWGSLAAASRQTHRTLPVIDGLMLATAATHALIFVTRNVRDCADRGVPLLDPWNDDPSAADP